MADATIVNYLCKMDTDIDKLSTQCILSDASMKCRKQLRDALNAEGLNPEDSNHLAFACDIQVDDDLYDEYGEEINRLLAKFAKAVTDVVLKISAKFGGPLRASFVKEAMGNSFSFKVRSEDIFG